MIGPDEDDPNDYERRQTFGDDVNDERPLDEIFEDDPEERRRRVRSRTGKQVHE